MTRYMNNMYRGRRNPSQRHRIHFIQNHRRKFPYPQERIAYYGIGSI